jgi:hypothetical protein
MTLGFFISFRRRAQLSIAGTHNPSSLPIARQGAPGPVFGNP